METTAYYAFGVPIYAGLLFAEATLARRRGRAVLPFSDSIGNVSAGLGSIAVGLVLGIWLLTLYDWAYDTFALVRWPKEDSVQSWIPWLLAMVLADLGHYWHHRIDHRVAACWAVHGVHHQPRRVDFSVAMRHAWFSDLYSFPYYAVLPLVGVPTSHFFVATTFLSFHALLTHSLEYNFPSFGILVTPRSHSLHHAKNERYINKNFGAMFCVWDKLFGTHVVVDPREPPEYGTVRGYETHDGALSQYVLWKDLLALLRQVSSARERLRILFSRPGYAPPGASLPPLPPVTESAALARPWKLYIGAQFLMLIACSLYVFVFREACGIFIMLIALFAIVGSIAAIGGLLDARRGAERSERVRLCGFAAGAAVLLAAGAHPTLALLLLGNAAVGLCWSALLGGSPLLATAEVAATSREPRQPRSR